MTESEDKALWAAYARARYLVWPFGTEGGVVFDLRAGGGDPRFDHLLAVETPGVTEWAVITAWNPGSTPFPELENRRRQAELERLLEARQLRWWPARGESADRSWSEESLLVLGASKDVAVALGRRFEQRAVLVGKVGQPAELVACSPGRASRA